MEDLINPSNAGDRTLSNLLEELKITLLDAGEPLNLEGSLAKRIEFIQQKAEVSIIDIAQINLAIKYKDENLKILNEIFQKYNIQPEKQGVLSLLYQLKDKIIELGEPIGPEIAEKINAIQKNLLGVVIDIEEINQEIESQQKDSLSSK